MIVDLDGKPVGGSNVKPPLEFLRGRVIQKVSPNLPHSALATELPARINAFARPARLGRAFDRRDRPADGTDALYVGTDDLPRALVGRRSAALSMSAT